MALEFVHSTAESRRHSYDTMRRIRAQVMRHYRRHNDGPRADNTSPTPSPTVSSTSSSTVGDPSVPIALSSSAGRRETRSLADNAPRLTPTELRSLLRLWERWQYIGSDQQGRSLNLLNAQWHTPANDLALCALGLEAVGHLEGLQGLNTFLEEEVKTRVKIRFLGLMHDVLYDTQEALSDATLAALACLVSFEVRNCIDSVLRSCRLLTR